MRDKHKFHIVSTAPCESFCMCICGIYVFEKQLQKQAAAQFGNMDTRMQQSKQLYSLLLAQVVGIIDSAISW